MEDGKANPNPNPNPNPVNQEQNPSVNSSNNSNTNNNNVVSTNNNVQNDEGRGAGEDSGRRRTPFTDLSQVDADLALARTLQEQERAYMMLTMHGADGGDYGAWIDGDYGPGDEEDEDFDDTSEAEYEGDHANDEVAEEEDEQEEEEDEDEDEEEEEEEEEDAFDIHAHDEGDDDGSQDFEIDPSAFSSDEAYARALQEAEERGMAVRLLAMAGINRMDIGEAEDEEDHGDNAQDVWEEVDPDELSYEELIALGEVVGTESRGLSANTIASLPSVKYKSQATQDGNTDSCVICRLDYEEGDTLTVLTCKHSYHSDCINHWLQINKVCPVCSAEVSTTGNS